MILSVKTYFDVGGNPLDQEEIYAIQETLQEAVNKAIISHKDYVKGLGYTISISGKKIFSVLQTWNQVKNLLKLQPVKVTKKSTKSARLDGISPSFKLDFTKKRK